MDSELLNDAASVERAVDLLQKAASVSFTEDAAKELTKPNCKLGTLVVGNTHVHPCLLTLFLVLAPLSNAVLQVAAALHGFPPGILKILAVLRGRTSPFESDFSHMTSPLGGCLARHLSAWEDLGAENWVFRVLRDGYKYFSTPFHR